jgi:hypothetical protein
MNIPAVEVGILSSETVYFKLNGSFRSSAWGDISGQEGYAVVSKYSSLRLIRLRIVGSKQTLVIGKELEIMKQKCHQQQIIYNLPP